MKKQQTLILQIGIAVLALGVLIGTWAILSKRQAENNTTAENGPKLVSLQSDNQILPEYKTYAFTIQESWVKDAGFNLKKRLYPARDTTGTIRFNVPTEYFEVGLSTDSEKGATNINIVAASIRKSGVSTQYSAKDLDTLFEKGSLTNVYDTVRSLADGRSKAEIAQKGCLVSASAYEKDKLRKLVDILFAHCNDVLTKK